MVNINNHKIKIFIKELRIETIINFNKKWWSNLNYKRKAEGLK